MKEDVGESAPTQVAQRLAVELAARGARAVALVGSHATGRATNDSDLDLAVVGEGPHYRLECHHDLLVSIGWAELAEQRRRLYDPSYLAMHVPGWRDAVLLHDPDGVAAAVKREAHEWSWNQVADECDRWVAEGVTGYAEEVQKLVALRHGGHVTLAAAIQRSVLGVRLARILAVHRRILYASENRLWDVVAIEMGEAWNTAQRAALGLGGENFGETCGASLKLFVMAAQEVRPLLDGRQSAVVERAQRQAEIAAAIPVRLPAN